MNVWAALSLSIVVPFGFYTKLYTGPADWVNNSLGGVFYEIFWCLLVLLLWSRATPWKIAAAVFAATCLLEFLQLWHPPFLELLRSTFIGRTVLGTTFAWSDFQYYALGCGIGWGWMRTIPCGRRPGSRPLNAFSGRKTKFRHGSKQGRRFSGPHPPAPSPASRRGGV